MFVVFFAILYAILTYGLIFAAQDGARRMLRVQADDTMVELGDCESFVIGGQDMPGFSR